MPNFPTGVTVKVFRGAVASWKDALGSEGTSSYDGFGGLVTDAQLDEILDSVGDISNAGMAANHLKTDREISEGLIVAFDEAESSVTAKMNLTFQDADLNTRTFTIPAPDKSYFNADGISVITPDTSDAAHTRVKRVVDAILAALNEPPVALGTAGTFLYIKGNRTIHSRGARKIPSKPSSPEPTGGDLPPA